MSYFIMCNVSVPVAAPVHIHMDRGPDPLGLQLQVTLSFPIWVLGTEPGPSARTVSELILTTELTL